MQSMKRSNPYKRASATKRRKTRALAPIYKGTNGSSVYYGRYAPLGTELKFYDQSAGPTAASSTGTIASASLCTVASGTGESQRIGRKITISSIHLRVVASLNATTTASNTDDGLRVILYWDKQCNGASAAVTDILETGDYLSYNNLSNKNRFTILADKMVDVSATAGAYNGTTNQFAQKANTHSWNIRCRLPVEFSSTTGVIGEIRSNNLGLLMVSDNNQVQYRYQARVRFSDN